MGMVRVDFWPRVFWRAIRDTFLFFGGARLFLVPATFAIGAIIHLVRSDFKSVLAELDVAVSFGFLAFLVVWAALFAINLFLTPARMESEATALFYDEKALLLDRVSNLERQIFDREKRQEAISRLWEVRSEGVHLRNRLISGPEEFEGWMSEYEGWASNLLTEAERVSPNLKKWLETLDQVRKPPNFRNVSLDDIHQKQRADMSEMLLRVQEFLEADMLNRDINRIERHDEHPR